MAKKTNITYKSKYSGDNQSQNNGQNVPFSQTNNNYWQQYQDGMNEAKAQAPANSAPPQVVSDTEQQSKELNNPYIQKARQGYMPQNPSFVAQGTGFVPKYQYSNPTVYNQSDLDNYYKGLSEAQYKDATSGSGLNVYQNVYKILHNRPEAQLTPYVNPAIQRQTTYLGDGSSMMNPNTTPGLALQWNVARLKQLHPDWDEAMIKDYMGRNFNWQVAQALTNTGAWEPTQASRDWTAYQAEQARQAALAQQLAASQSAAYGDYSGDGSDYTGGGSDDSGYEETAPYDPNDPSGGVNGIQVPSTPEYPGTAIEAPRGEYITPDDPYANSSGAGWLSRYYGNGVYTGY